MDIKYFNTNSFQFNRLMVEKKKIGLPYYTVESKKDAFGWSHKLMATEQACVLLNF